MDSLIAGGGPPKLVLRDSRDGVAYTDSFKLLPVRKIVQLAGKAADRAKAAGESHMLDLFKHVASLHETIC